MPQIEKVVIDIPFAGIQGLTTIDFPGYLSAVIFTRGCPWNCRYCHNHELRDYINESLVSWESIESFLISRLGYLEGIVISGGEPTLHPSLPDLLSYIRELGFKTAIHTNGFLPALLQKIIKKGLVDYVALDVKGPPRVYDRITRNRDTCLPVSKSINIIISSGIEYEFRTTYHPMILSEEELLETMQTLSSIGCRRYYLQKFRKNGVCDAELVKFELSVLPVSAVTLGEKLFPEFGTR